MGLLSISWCSIAKVRVVIVGVQRGDFVRLKMTVMVTPLQLVWARYITEIFEVTR